MILERLDREMTFGEKLTRLIHEKRTNQSRLARQTGIAQTTISAMSYDKQRPYVDQAFLIAKALGVTLDYLADQEADEPIGDRESSDDDQAVLRLMRALRLDPDEALRRLATGPMAEAHGYGKVVADQDLSESTLRREQERNRARRAPDSPSPSPAKGHDEGADAGGVPSRRRK